MKRGRERERRLKGGEEERRTTDNCCPARRINDCQPADTGSSHHECCALVQRPPIEKDRIVLRRTKERGVERRNGWMDG